MNIVGPIRRPLKPLRNFAADWQWRGPTLPSVYDLAMVRPVAGVTRATNYFAACGIMGVYCDRGDDPMAAAPMIKGLPGNAQVYAIALDPNDATGMTLFVSAVWLDAAGHQKSGVFKTIDLENWVALNVPTVAGMPPSMPQYGMSHFAFVDPGHQANTLYAAGDVGVLKTTDGGLTWTTANNGLPTRLVRVRTIAIDPLHTQTHYCAATWYDAAGASNSDVFKRTSSGSWQATGLGREALSLAVDAKGITVYAGTTDGVFKCEQYGAKTWSHIVPAYANADCPQGTVEALVADPTDYTMIFAGTQDGVFWGIESGAGWQAMNSELINFQVYANLSTTRVHALGMTVEPRSGSWTGKTLYAGIDGGVLRIYL